MVVGEEEEGLVIAEVVVVGVVVEKKTKTKNNRHRGRKWVCLEVQMTERNCVWLVLVLLSIYLFISMVVMVKVIKVLWRGIG